jgi:hypothetical protein
LAKSDLEMPLGHLQARELHRDVELIAVLQTVASIFGASPDETPIANFLDDLPALEALMPPTHLSVRIFRQDNTLRLAVQNTGSRPLKMVEAELLIPESLRRDVHFQDFAPVRLVHRQVVDGVRLIGYRLTTTPSPVLYLGINPLRSFLTAGMGEEIVSDLGINLPADLSAADEELAVRYTVCAEQCTVGPIKRRIADIPRVG